MIEIIGEIGVNHNGSLLEARKLAEMARRVGCDVVKTQLWNSERVYPRNRWREMKSLELTRDEIVKLKEYCDNIGIEFMCTPDELGDAEFLKEIGVKRIKTSSQDITDLVFLKSIVKLNLPMVVSTGACNQNEMDAAYFALTDAGIKASHLTMMHCISAYPSPLTESNMLVLSYMESCYPCELGFSDHTTGSTAAIVALGLGARVFEKHLTMNKKQKGPDHICSMEPREMAEYVKQLRDAYLSLGDGLKRIADCEIANRTKYESLIQRRRHADRLAATK